MKHRAAIRDSRIGPTRRLAELIAQSERGPKVLISWIRYAAAGDQFRALYTGPASAIGF